MFHRACPVSALAVTMILWAPSGITSPTGTTTPGIGSSTAPSGCFAVGGGYLRARIRGAMDLDLNWKNAEMHCEGGPRPSGNGLRVSIGGPARGDEHRLRLVFGIAGVREGGGGEGLRTNLTVLFEGEKRIFATQGDDKCTVDTLTQERVESLAPDRAVYRVIARGFCLGPASSLSQDERVTVTSFDFAGRVEFSDDDRRAPAVTHP